MLEENNVISFSEYKEVKEMGIPIKVLTFLKKTQLLFSGPLKISSGYRHVSLSDNKKGEKS